MVSIRINNVVAQVHGADIETHLLIGQTLAYRPEGYMFSPAYKGGTWDGYTNLYNKPDRQREFGKFWTGLLHRVSTTLSEAGISYEIFDDRVEPPKEDPIKVAVKEERDYQLAIRAASDKTRGIIKVATAGGKTAMSGLLIGHLNQPTIFIAHKIGLVEQAREGLHEALGVPIGILQAENRELQRFNVATVQTLDNILWSMADQTVRDFIQKVCQLVIVDEVHHTTSPSYKRVLGHLQAAYYRFGFSATPHRYENIKASQDMVVEGAFGRIILNSPWKELMSKGHLARVHAFRL